MKKKIINTAIALVLIVVSVVLFGYRGSTPIAHEDVYTNEKIGDMEELYDVSNFILYGLNTGSVMENTKYHSATIHITLSEKLNVSLKRSDSLFKASEQISIEQEITCYLAENGVYIESQAALFTSLDNEFEKNVDPTRGYAKYNVNIYLSKDKAYIKIIEYTLAISASSAKIKADYTNQWIETTKDIAMNFLPLGYETEVAIDGFAYLFRALLDSGDINKDDIFASFDEDSLVNIDAWEIGDLEASGIKLDMDKYKESFKIDLSDKTRPYISMGAGYRNKDEEYVYEGEAWGYTIEHTTTVKTNLKATLEMVISNVNNTVIDWKTTNFSTPIEVKTPEAFRSLFVIKGYEVIGNE